MTVLRLVVEEPALPSHRGSPTWTTLLKCDPDAVPARRGDNSRVGTSAGRRFPFRDLVGDVLVDFVFDPGNRARAQPNPLREAAGLLHPVDVHPRPVDALVLEALVTKQTHREAPFVGVSLRLVAH